MSLVSPNRQDGNLKHSCNTAVLNTSPSHFNGFLELSMKICIQVSLEVHLVYYSNEKQPVCVCFWLETGLNKFFQKISAQIGISCIKCVLEEF